MISIQDVSIDANMSRDIIINAITSTEYLKRFVSIPEWKGLIPIDWADSVLAACVMFYKKFNGAPKKQYILDYLDRNQSSFRFKDDSLPSLIEFLEGLPEEVSINPDYEIQNTIQFFHKQSLHIANERLTSALDSGNIELAEQAIKIRSSEIDEVEELDVLDMDEDLQEATERAEEPLLNMGGAFGELLSPHITKGSLVFVMATAKAGKTWCLYTIGAKIYNSGKNVLIFAAGDLDRLDNSIRIGHIMSRGDTASSVAYSGVFAFPVIDCRLNQDQTCDRSTNCHALPTYVEEMMKEMDSPEQLLSTFPAGYSPCANCKSCPDAVLTWAYEPRDVQYKGWQGLNTHKEISKRRNGRVKFKIKVYPNNTLTTKEIERQVKHCVEVEGWTPEAVLIDYADIMADEEGTYGKDTRGVENERWKNLRRLSQSKYGYGVITLTQSNRGGYSQDSLDETNVNEDRRKLDHATAIFALNQTDTEKDFRIARMACLRARGKSMSKRREIVLLQAYEAGKFAREAFWRRKSNKK